MNSLVEQNQKVHHNARNGPPYRQRQQYDLSIFSQYLLECFVPTTRNKLFQFNFFLSQLSSLFCSENGLFVFQIESESAGCGFRYESNEWRSLKERRCNSLFEKPLMSHCTLCDLFIRRIVVCYTEDTVTIYVQWVSLYYVQSATETLHQIFKWKKYGFFNGQSLWNFACKYLQYI